MTERADYQAYVEESQCPNIFAVDYLSLSPEEIEQIRAERFAKAINIIDELTPDDEETFKRERVKRDIFNETVKRAFGSRKILGDLTEIPEFISFLYTQNMLTAVEEKEFRKRIDPVLQETGINFPE